MMTGKFMVGIIEEKYWMMKAEDVTHYRTCAYPPTKEKLAAEVAKNLIAATKNEDNQAVCSKRVKRTAHHIRKKLPCKKWLLLVLA